MSIPPLSQSKQALMSCPHRYAMETIYGQKQVEGEAARRGSTIHTFLQMYVRGLVNHKERKLGSLFDSLLRGMEPGAREIVEPLRDEFEIDPEAVFATEQQIALTEAFLVTPAGAPGAAYQMTLDLIELHDETMARIIDYKSNFMAFDPDTFQSKLYSLGVFALNPQIEQVEFCLKFVRWRKARSVIYTREQVPGLQCEAAMWRERQIALHQEGTKLEAYPGPHCAYCSLLCNGCPIESNPYGGIESHLRAAIYHKMAYDKAREVLKAHADEGGPIRAKDGIGQEYEAAWTVTDKKVFTVDVLPVLQKWDKAHKNDPVLPKVTISGLSSLLKAKKRSELADEAANHCEVKTGKKFKIGRVNGEEEGGDDE